MGDSVVRSIFQPWSDKVTGFVKVPSGESALMKAVATVRPVSLSIDAKHHHQPWCENMRKFQNLKVLIHTYFQSLNYLPFCEMRWHFGLFHWTGPGPWRFFRHQSCVLATLSPCDRSHLRSQVYCHRMLACWSDTFIALLGLTMLHGHCYSFTFLNSYYW